VVGSGESLLTLEQGLAFHDPVISPRFGRSPFEIAEPRSGLIAHMSSGMSSGGGLVPGSSRLLVTGSNDVGRSLSASTIEAVERATIRFDEIGEAATLTSRRSFRNFLWRSSIRPDDPLHRLIDPLTGRLRPSTSRGITAEDWFHDPRFVESGHWRSAKMLGGTGDQFVVMSTWRNRMISATIEHPARGGAMFDAGRTLLIGRAPVEYETALDLLQFGALKPEVFGSAPLIRF
jgi:hypothetical protein